MKEFYSKKKYYIHEYQAIVDWFGNRGIPLNYGDIKEWCYDGHFLYFLCSKHAPEEITPSEIEGGVMMCVLDSMCYECYTEITYQESPFFDKIYA